MLAYLVAEMYFIYTLTYLDKIQWIKSVKLRSNRTRIIPKLPIADPVRGLGVLDDQPVVPRGLLLHLLRARPHLAHPAGHVRARRVPAHAQAPLRPARLQGHHAEAPLLPRLSRLPPQGRLLRRTGESVN